MGMKGTPGQEEALTLTRNWGEVTAEFIPVWHGKHELLLRITMIPDRKTDSELSFPGAPTVSTPLGITGWSLPRPAASRLCSVRWISEIIGKHLIAASQFPSGILTSETRPLLWKLNLQNFQQKGAFWDQKYYTEISPTYITPCRINLTQTGTSASTNRNNLEEDHRWVTVSCF